MTLEELIAKSIIIIEFSILIIILLFTISYKLYSRVMGIVDSKIARKMEYVLLSAIIHEQKFEARLFKNTWKDLNKLLSIIIKFDELYNDERWHKVKFILQHEIVTPLARTNAFKVDVVARMYVAKAFSNYAEAKDEEILLRLVNGPSPFVFHNAAKAAIKIALPRPIYAFIERISTQAWVMRTSSLHVFEDMPKATEEIIISYLQQTENISIKAVCYNVLINSASNRQNVDPMADIENSDLELKLAALKYFAAMDPVAAVPILINQLSEPNLTIKLVAIHRLATIRAEQAIASLVECLSDTEWIVRINAAKALIGYGDIGSGLVAKFAPDLAVDANRINFLHKPNTLW